MKRLLVPVLDFALRAARRLRFFPFSLAFLAAGAWLRRIELRRMAARGGPGGHALVHAGSAGAAAAEVVALNGAPTDLLLDLSGTGDAAAGALFATALANPAVRSVACYWDPAALAEDLPLWGPAAARDPSRPAPRPLPYAGALRDGELLVLRLAGGRLVHVIDDPAVTAQEALALATESPELLFLDLGTGRGRLPGQRPGNLIPLGEAGLSLHQKLALVRAADMYIGTDPVLAAAAPRAADLPTLQAQGGLRNRVRVRPAAGDTIH